MRRLLPYVQIMRVDHWFKNVLVLPGVMLAYVLNARVPQVADLAHLLLGLLAPSAWPPRPTTPSAWPSAGGWWTRTRGRRCR